ncbi:MAG: hypothetical protein HRT88_21390, partial [Lentisphaeraceae bacterium]|nr:hypothetical protein [Lentisphaeraceae bacterium]
MVPVYDEAFELQEQEQDSPGRYEVLAIIEEGASKKNLTVRPTLTLCILAMPILSNYTPEPLDVSEREAHVTTKSQHP